MAYPRPNSKQILESKTEFLFSTISFTGQMTCFQNTNRINKYDINLTLPRLIMVAIQQPSE